MMHETLYKRAKTGAIQYWKVMSSHREGYGSQVIKESGKLGTTKPLRHVEDINSGKHLGKSNETSPEQQADLQAASDWRGKRDEGYKSLEDLGIHEAAIENTYSLKNGPVFVGTLAEALDKALSEFNSDANGNVKPMLANSVKWDKVKYPVYVQPKLDGVRCLMVSTINENGSPSTVFLSRKGKEFITLDHIRFDVDAYQYSFLPGPFILDGEVYSDELSFQEIVQAVKKQYPNSLKLKFRAYDIVTDSLQHTRLTETEQLVTSLTSEHITMVETNTVHSPDVVKALHDEWVKRGYEGAMIRLMDGRYEQGARSQSLLKVKEYMDAEFAFKNFEFGQRGVQDLIAVCWTPDGEKEFRAKVVGTTAEKEHLYEVNDVSEGKSFTVRYFGLTDDGIPRHPIGVGFRDYE